MGIQSLGGVYLFIFGVNISNYLYMFVHAKVSLNGAALLDQLMLALYHNISWFVIRFSQWNSYTAKHVSLSSKFLKTEKRLTHSVNADMVTNHNLATFGNRFFYDVIFACCVASD